MGQFPHRRPRTSGGVDIAELDRPRQPRDRHQPHRLVKCAVAVEGRDHAERNAQQHGEEDGEQRQLEVGLALATAPKLLLLDEPMAGMNVEEKQDMCRFILDVNDEFGTTIVLIEHDMGVVMDISDRVVVLDYGKKIGDGTPDEVRNNPEVISAYLGTGH